MISRICSRCHAVLHREDESALVFCWNCGAPQVQLSEELREQADKQNSGPHAEASAPMPQPPPANAIDWTGAIQCVGIAGAVAAAITLLSLVLPPVVLFSLFWIFGAPIVILGIYSARFRASRITAAFGARLGLLSGLAITFATLTIDTAGILLQRYVFHSSAAFDGHVADLFVQMQSQMQYQMHATGTPESASTLAAVQHMLAIPEFRAGLVLCSAAIMLLFYLAYSATTGAFAGYLRSRSAR